MKQLIFTSLLLMFIQWCSFSQVTLVRDINAGSPSSGISNLIDYNGFLFFTANNGSTGTELYRSNGTTSGTVNLKDINPGAASSSPDNFVIVNETLLFVAEDAENGREIWKSTGMSYATSVLKDIVAGTASSNPDNLISIGSNVYFSTSASGSAPELWKTNGTTAGTTLIKSFSGPFGLSQFVNANGTLYFVIYNELWKSDGTTAGTVLVKTLTEEIDYLKALNGIVVFTSNYSGLWRSNGTAAGTVLVKDIDVWGPEFTFMNDYLYFFGEDAAKGRELWKTNGFSYTTSIVKDINTSGGAFSYYYQNGLTNFNNTLFFVGTNSSGEKTLYKSNGTSSGTIKINNAPTFQEEEQVKFVSSGGFLYFFQGGSLWRTDGTEAGTTEVEINLNPTLELAEMRELNSTLFIEAWDSSAGYELRKYIAPATARIASQIFDETKPSLVKDLINVYPNSFHNSTNLSVSGVSTIGKMITVKVSNLNGKVVLTQEVKEDEVINFGGNLSPGIYFIQVMAGDKSIARKRIIKE